MTEELTTEALVEQSIARLTAESQELSGEIQLAAAQALEDWLLVEACKDYDTIRSSKSNARSTRSNPVRLRTQKSALPHGRWGRGNLSHCRLSGSSTA